MGVHLSKWNFSNATGALASLELSGANRVVADHWLASWKMGRAPRLDDFDTRAIVAHVPALAIFASPVFDPKVPAQVVSALPENRLARR